MTKPTATDNLKFNPQPYSGAYDVQVEQVWREQFPELYTQGVPLVALMDVLKSHVDLFHRKAFKHLGHNHLEYSILLTLKHNEGPLRPSLFAELYSRPSAYIAQALNRLEKEGLLKRIKNPADARSSLVELTEDGEARARLLAELEAERAENVFGNLSEKEIATMRKTLNKLITLLVTAA